MIAATFNGLDALLAALVIAFSFIAWLCFQDFDRWVHYETETERGSSREIDVPTVPGEARGRKEPPRSVSAARPFDWQEST
jgi:hypothetical protein